jgi:hypothetical protein
MEEEQKEEQIVTVLPMSFVITIVDDKCVTRQLRGLPIFFIISSASCPLVCRAPEFPMQMLLSARPLIFCPQMTHID